jgi:hypothetical protein
MEMIHAYISTLYGTILFLIVILRRDKDKFDDGNLKFSWVLYKESHWDNWLMAFAVIPLVAHWLPDLLSFVYDGKWHTGFYALSGFLVEYAYDKYLSKYINK